MPAMHEIADALLKRCEDLEVGTPSLPVAMPDVSFTPPQDGKYLSVTFRPNAPRWEGVNQGRIDQGLLQIDVVWPKDAGVLAPMRIADAVMARFPKGLRLAPGIKITAAPYVMQPLLEGNRTICPITISWVA
jgi:hypothetical protein